MKANRQQHRASPVRKAPIRSPVAQKRQVHTKARKIAPVRHAKVSKAVSKRTVSLPTRQISSSMAPLSFSTPSSSSSLSFSPVTKKQSTIQQYNTLLPQNTTFASPYTPSLRNFTSQSITNSIAKFVNKTTTMVSSVPLYNQRRTFLGGLFGGKKNEPEQSALPGMGPMDMAGGMGALMSALSNPTKENLEKIKAQLQQLKDSGQLQPQQVALLEKLERGESITPDELSKSIGISMESLMEMKSLLEQLSTAKGPMEQMRIFTKLASIAQKTQQK